MKRAALLLIGCSLALTAHAQSTQAGATQAGAMQGMDMHDMAGMQDMPAPPSPSTAAQQAATTPQTPPAMPMAPSAHHHMPGMAPSPAAQPSAQAASNAPAGTDLPAAHGSPPPMPMDHDADRFFPKADMDRARAAMMRESGGQTHYMALLNLAEWQLHAGHDGYRWDGEAYVGGDINRLWIKSEGQGTLHQSTESAEMQALFSHAITPYFNLQIGVRQDIRPTPARTYATVGIEGLAPYGFETEAALFLSTKGDLLARLEGWHDMHITQRVILQPRAELNFAAQNVPQDRYGAGLVDAELGLRLRYEIRRNLAPYVGVTWDGKTGKSADYARADGQGASQTSLVLGLRSWF